MNNADNHQPCLAVTLGDVAGIGPEVTVKMMLGRPELRRQARLFVIGDAASLRSAADRAGFSATQIRSVASPADVQNNPDILEVLQVGDSLADVPLGQCDARAGAAAAQFVLKACELGRKGEIDGIVTAPLNKEAMHMGGYNWPGHTELLAHEFGVERFSLVLSAEDLFVFHATTHVSMAQAVRDCTPERFDEIFRLIGAFQRALGRKGEEVVVCGLNPHAGESGLFGREEMDVIQPAVQRANAAGLQVVGPLPADVAWPKVNREKKWKFLVCCYHDQGHAPFKAIHGENGVNITVGLPIVRVSVDHGTAFDIAGKNIARDDSLVLATERAAELALGWRELWTASNSNS